MRAAICDDEATSIQEYTQRFGKMAERHGVDLTLEAYSNPQQLLFALEEAASVPDLLLLDIGLPEMNGLELARQIRRENELIDIVFLTKSPEYVFEAFDVNALHYIVKDKTADSKIEEVFMRAAARAAERHRKMISFTCAGEQRRIPIDEILYFEVENHIISVFYGEEQFQFYSTMSQVENELAARGFLRVHRAYIVSMQHVETVAFGELTTDNGKKIPVGRNYYENLKKTWERMDKIDKETPQNL